MDLHTNTHICVAKRMNLVDEMERKKLNKSKSQWKGERECHKKEEILQKKKERENLLSL